MMTEARKVFWTGGFDSTFRVAQLVLNEATSVAPIYLIDLHRKSFPVELRAIDKMRGMIQDRAPSGATLYPLQAFNREDFPADPEVDAAYQSLQEETRIGSQYWWLAQFCKERRFCEASVEIALQRHEDGPTPLHEALFVDAASGDLRLKSDAAREIFKYYTFPVLRYTKRDMWRIAAQEGFSDVLRATWYCHSPILGRVCGVCTPCRVAAQEDPENARRSMVALFMRLDRKIRSWSRIPKVKPSARGS